MNLMNRILLPLLLLSAVRLGSFPLPAQVLTGLQLWLKPEGLTNTVNLSPVSHWANALGTGYDATNGIPANQPVVVLDGLNGWPVVRFLDNGSNVPNNPGLDWLVSPLPLSANSNSFTVVIVAESQLSGERDTLVQQLGNGTTILYLQTNAAPAPSPTLNSFASAQALAAPYAYERGRWRIFAVVQDAVAGTLSLYENGQWIDSTAIGTLNSPADQGWLLGCNKNKNTHGLNGDIAEVLIYDTALSGGELGATTYYLAQKFGFVVLTDNFDTANTPNLDQEVGARQSGYAAPVGYDWTLAEIFGNGVKLAVGNGPFTGQSFCPDTNLVALTGKDFVVRYEITSFEATGGLYDTWAGVVINSSLKPINPVSPDGLAAIIFTNGAHVIFLNGAQSFGVNPGGPPGDPEYDALSVRAPYQVEIAVANNVATFTLSGTNSYGPTNVVSVHPLSCPVGNYVSLSIGGFAGTTVTYDNLNITASPKASEIIPDLVAAPTLLLADTFDTADTANLDENLAGRQSGAAAAVAYSTVGIFNADARIEGNRLVLRNTPTATDPSLGIAAPNLDFRLLERLSSFRLRCTLSPVGTVNEWAGIRFRDNFPGVFVANNSTPGVGFIVRGNGNWAMFLGGTVIAQGAAVPGADYALEVDVRDNVMRATLNGETLSVGCGETSFALPPTQTGNFITLQSFANPDVTGYYATFDNLQIESLDIGRVVPPPVLLNPTFVTGETNAFTFDFDSLANVFYVVESRSDLAPAPWTDVNRRYGLGGRETVTNAPAGASPGFYRLRVP